MYKRYKHAGSKEKVISLLGKKNTGKKTPKEDSELGYSDFTLTLTIHLPHPQQKGMQLSPMHKNLNTRVVSEANLWRKARRSARWWVRFPGTHILCNLDTLSGVLSNNRTINIASCYLHSAGARRPSR